MAPPAAALVPQSRQDIAIDDDGPGQSEFVEIRLDRAARLTVALDEHTTRCAARESFETERPRPREQIEHGCAVDRPDQRERGLANAIACGTRNDSLGSCYPVTPSRARNDPHVTTLVLPAVTTVVIRLRSVREGREARM